MRKPITFQKASTQSDWNELKAFAASFSHTVDDTSRTPMWMVRRGGKLFAYFSVAAFPVIMPNLHPEHTSPRDFVEFTEQVRAWQWLNSSGNDRYPKGCVLCCFGKTNAKTQRAVEELGFTRIGDLWEAVG